MTAYEPPALDVQSLFGLPRGTVVLVTGGARGIGKMIATGFVQNGARVYISSRTSTTCDATAAELNALGPGQCISLPADLSDFAECQRVKSEIAKEGVLHVLVNNSGRTYDAPFAEHSDTAWDDVMTLNVRRVFTLVQALTPLLERGGRVINIGSMYGISVTANESFAYCASKAALHQLGRHLALHLGPRGITVNTLALGAFPTDMLTASLENSVEEIAQGVPLRRLGQASDIAGTCIYLASRAGAWTTGAIIPVDGGSMVVPQGVL
ncbi:hypothetical protein CcaverHIS002_0202550 [Cutaneotrichosporon cavernicola]|uniref:Ketoreductase domain-containing protein n=1 Tax=Cutaneotrichosporon cavernicola TaxID=279322 RepID=A0AA48KY12_9TREE|nr:uncharacterized protein CcaverHIS019_0202560 [Cutaneotrichosporon cavernicola]BEI81095.1 hypothetical protein CcaverHIS002_0202550 [Cutaneotrichosporon cavernicola]BEI88894.1 hypothetical protein CcaverHIS019_0202560 [Cutaneotrichosporon cavernicola]BEI96671.1 hypothetical protein CcaverHIS631_0202600 [Cutaneotrichosporon cavernicola]